ncbi:hypothetical protein [Nocardia grenadensis]
MSLIPQFLTQGTFYAAFIPGAACGAVVTAGSTYFNNRSSDNRKARQEHEKLDRVEAREDKRESDERLRKACAEYASVCEQVLIGAIDTKAIFNALRDAVLQPGQIDPKGMSKVAFAETQIDEMKRVGKAYSDLKLEAPSQIMSAATRSYQALQMLTRATTEPFAKAVLVKTAAEELNKFIEVFRDHFGIGRYGYEDAERDTETFVDTLKVQIRDFVEEAKHDLREAGFRSTPWD